MEDDWWREKDRLRRLGLESGLHVGRFGCNLHYTSEYLHERISSPLMVMMSSD